MEKGNYDNDRKDSQLHDTIYYGHMVIIWGASDLYSLSLFPRSMAG